MCTFYVSEKPNDWSLSVSTHPYVYPLGPDNNPSQATPNMRWSIIYLGGKVGTVVGAFAFHQCVPRSIPGPGVISGLSLLILCFAPRGFSPGTPVFPSPKKPTFDLIWFDCGWFHLVSPISRVFVPAPFYTPEDRHRTWRNLPESTAQ